MHRRVWYFPVVATLGLIISGCDQPTQPPAAKPGLATLAKPVGVRVVGRDTIYSGDAARVMIAERARWYAAAGDSLLMQELRRPVWKPAQQSGILKTQTEASYVYTEEEEEAAAQANIPTNAWGAVVLASSTIAAASGAQGSVASTVTFFGTHGQNTINYSATKNGANVAGPGSVNDQGMAPGTWSCLSSLWALATCTWIGTYQTSLPVPLGSACGVTLTASGEHRAWFGLYVGVQSRGISVSVGEVGADDHSVDLASSASNLTCTPPTAHFTMSGGGQSAGDGGTLSISTSDVNGHSVSFNASGSSAGSGTISSYSWTVDGQNESGGSSWSRGFSPGTYSVGLTVTNSAGLSSSAAGTITVVYDEEDCDDSITEEVEPCDEEDDEEQHEWQTGGYDDGSYVDTLLVRCWWIDVYRGSTRLYRIDLGCEIIG